ncbi:hypothetical protein AB0B66_03105 [Catellatospora sp. NPDC049111]|uniref:hypothetical protein n=1 Tax=Catellatospora sp. NPDC049111 TaxID=3155271 RepID=UPI0033E575FB
MEARHREITKIALASAGRYGFALAGGYAVQAHGMGNRLSSDVDPSPTPGSKLTSPAPSTR